MRYIKKRFIPRTDYDSTSQKWRRIREHRVKRCGTCTYEVPASDVVLEDGAEHCPMCMDVMTSEWKANELDNVARIKGESAVLAYLPQLSIRSLNEVIPSAVTSITDSDGIWVTQTSPLAMFRGEAITLLLNGRRFASTDTITYSTGISDDSAISRTDTVTTLSIIADLGMGAGSYSLTFNGHVYRNILSVR